MPGLLRNTHLELRISPTDKRTLVGEYSCLVTSLETAEIASGEVHKKQSLLQELIISLDELKK